jgi:PTS system nitrogen regulatory IIA component
MEVRSLFDPSRIARVESLPSGREELLRLLSELLTKVEPDEARKEREDAVHAALAERERVASTAVGDGIAFPHAKLPGIEAARAGLILLPEPGLPLDAPDGLPVRIVLGLVVPLDSIGEHLKVLGVLARQLRLPALREALLAAPDAEAILDVVGGLHGDLA